VPPPELLDAPVGGRLALFWRNWERLGADPWVVSVLRHGYSLEFRESPQLARKPTVLSGSNNPVRNLVLQDQIDAMLEKQAIEEVKDPSSPGFYSRLFVVPKKTGGWRPIIDLSVLNLCLNLHKFKMETPISIRGALHPGHWTFSIDLKDAYFHVPIHPASRKYLRMELCGKVYQFRALPFGVSSAPWLFTKVMAEVKQIAHLRSLSLFQYLDDWLGESPDRRTCSNRAKDLVQLCTHLGLIVNLEKSELEPQQVFTFIGVRFNLRVAVVSPTLENISKIHTAVTAFASKPSQPAVRWQSVIGILGAQERYVPFGRFHLRPLQIQLNSCWSSQRDDPSCLVPLTQKVISTLEWWMQPALLSGVPLHPLAPSLRIYTDASTQGWGAHVDGRVFQGLWSREERTLHINLLEMRAIRLALTEIQPTPWSVVLVSTDNTTVVAYINRQGGTRSHGLWEETVLLFQVIWDLQIELRARHIPGRLNVIADQLSRAGQILPTEWSLHQEAAQLLFDRWGQPNLDLFATRHNRKLSVFVSPVPDPLALGADALSLDWEGFLAYAYPPHQILNLVLRKFRETEHCRLILVAPFWPKQQWFTELCLLAVEPPVPLPLWERLLSQPLSNMTHLDPGFLNLHGWLLAKPL